jgi:hypothetical protein
MAIDPIQCMGNPWEQEWLAEHPGEQYPRDLYRRVPIIRDYYERQGIEIQDITAAYTYSVVCHACSCPAGYTVWIRVDLGYIDALVDMGFREEWPPF